MPGGWVGLVLTALVVFLISDLLLSFLGTGGSTTISYTEFNNQLGKGNITKIYAKGDAIEGTLKSAAPTPEGKGNYSEFTTQRPSFADDNLWSGPPSSSSSSSTSPSLPSPSSSSAASSPTC